MIIGFNQITEKTEKNLLNPTIPFAYVCNVCKCLVNKTKGIKKQIEMSAILRNFFGLSQ